MSVFKDLKAMKEAYKDLCPEIEPIKLTPEVFNYWINDKSTVKEKLEYLLILAKDKVIIKKLKRMIKCLKKK